MLQPYIEGAENENVRPSPDEIQAKMEKMGFTKIKDAHFELKQNDEVYLTIRDLQPRNFVKLKDGTIICIDSVIY